MDKNISCVLAFLGGAALSGFITWKVVSKKCEEKWSAIAQEEIDSVKERFTVPKKEEKDPVEEFIDSKLDNKIAKEAVNKPNLTEYASKLKNYTNYSNLPFAQDPEEDDTKVFVIAPDEYGDDEEYEQQELTFYADGILADEDDTILDADEVVGKGTLERIGEFEDDAIHVKNTKRKVYYEVLVDSRSYKDATGKDPHLDKDEEDE